MGGPRVTEAVLRQQIERALVCAGGTHTVDDVIDQCQRGEMQMWAGDASVIVTQILTYPRLKELCVFLAAGSMEEMVKLEPVIEGFGKAAGCARMVFAGRPGWARTFLTTERGWVSKMAVFEKVIG